MWNNPYLVPVVVLGGFVIVMLGLLIHSVRGPSKEELFLRHGERMEEPVPPHRAGGGLVVGGDGGWGAVGDGHGGGDSGDGGGGGDAGH
mgnify:CR=1 FL=1